MKEQLKIDFNKIKEVSNFSNRDIEIKKSYLNKFIEMVSQIENKKTGSF